MYLLADPFIKWTDEKYLQMAVRPAMCFGFVVGSGRGGVPALPARSSTAG
jgi:hypothetical protein